MSMKNCDVLNDHIKMKFMGEICRTIDVISRGIDSDIQIVGLIASLCL